MTMTRKNYEQVAAALTASRPAPGWSRAKHAQYRTTVREMAYVLKAENPRFDRGRFFWACGLDPDVPDEGDQAQALELARG